MRLITHNMLMCNKKGVVNGFPLVLKAEETEVVASEFSAEFIVKMAAKLDWAAFVAGAAALNVDVPSTPLSDADKSNEVVLKQIHHALLDVHVKKGALVCPESGREFPIVDGIPNMLLREDEV
ncbi:hypothetical protein DYB25_007447 [Aphanomyces astaci]|uniref:Multifunctional methyltransferase subunit TRM112-like protein n=1 Tax=Aphanomyces astaci TaxID=112090 RepID=A0A397F466_APHAT|nr:hypothetical protein DYB36_003364 [Aphanomyces astaci]RHY23670.1 hypothetical protein DYB25_007447 [Aphanomyces astaci]RHY46987.1 hypothetical protein DYB30_009465 [Aphanomyces astaci]RHY61119.1 hypothetical protein DYB38_008270 [Aphanomyces astaci]RHY64564.1 hypothetical protein DYB34_006988 [Aphanomyces astaci]